MQTSAVEGAATNGKCGTACRAGGLISLLQCFELRMSWYRLRSEVVLACVHVFTLRVRGGRPGSPLKSSKEKIASTPIVS